MSDKPRNDQDVVCPFCGEGELDLVGLKFHLRLYCAEYEETEELVSIFDLAAAARAAS